MVVSSGRIELKGDKHSSFSRDGSGNQAGGGGPGIREWRASSRSSGHLGLCLRHEVLLLPRYCYGVLLRD